MKWMSLRFSGIDTTLTYFQDAKICCLYFINNTTLAWVHDIMKSVAEYVLVLIKAPPYLFRRREAVILRRFKLKQCEVKEEVKNAHRLVYFLFLCQLGLFRFFLPRAPEGVLLIRAVSPATPQGSVSQPDSDTHIYSGPHTQTRTFTKSSLIWQVHIHTLIIWCTHAHAHTDIHAFILLLVWHLIPEGEQLKDAPLSPHSSIPSNSPCHLYLRLPFPLTVSHRSVKLTGDMIEMPQT